MQKTIYAGWCEHSANLYNFLRSKFGEVCHFETFRSFNPPERDDEVNVYRIVSKGVALVSYTETLPIFPPVQTLCLWGDEKDIGEVEKIIIEESVKHKSEPALAGR